MSMSSMTSREATSASRSLTGSTVAFGRHWRGHHDVVVKHVAPDMLWQPRYMSLAPAGVFAHVYGHNYLRDEKGHKLGVEYAMPHYLDYTEHGRSIRVALLAGLDKLCYLWRLQASPEMCAGLTAPWPRQDWRQLLQARLQGLAHEHLGWDPLQVATLIADIPDWPGQPCMTHGDATLANLVYDSLSGDWLWLDPLICPHIPHDPHVDLGKLYQSCWGYEKVLCDPVRGHLEFDRDLALKLAAMCGLSSKVAMRWCIVHMLRLLPYHSEAVNAHFIKTLRTI